MARPPAASHGPAQALFAVAAKNVMSSVPDYLIIESAFTAVQWTIVGPLMAFAHAKAVRTFQVTRQADRAH